MKAQGSVRLPTRSCQLSFEMPRISCLASSCSCRRAEVLPEALYHICQPPSDVSNTSGHFRYSQVPVQSLHSWPRDAPSTFEPLHLSRRNVNRRDCDLAKELRGEDGSSQPNLSVYSIRLLCELGFSAFIIVSESLANGAWKVINLGLKQTQLFQMKQPLHSSDCVNLISVACHGSLDTELSCRHPGCGHLKLDEMNPLFPQLFKKKQQQTTPLGGSKYKSIDLFLKTKFKILNLIELFYWAVVQQEKTRPECLFMPKLLNKIPLDFFFPEFQFFCKTSKASFCKQLSETILR